MKVDLDEKKLDDKKDVKNVSLGEKLTISELDMNKRKVALSIKLLEELQNKEAVSKFSSPLSGKNLPFSSLSDKLNKNKDEE